MSVHSPSITSRTLTDDQDQRNIVSSVVEECGDNVRRAAVILGLLHLASVLVGCHASTAFGY